MRKWVRQKFVLVVILQLMCATVNAQDTLSEGSSKPLKEVLVSYQADKFIPITFQNIHSKELKLKSYGQEPSFLLSETPSVTNYSDAGSMQGYSYFRLRGIDQTRINITLDGVPLNEPEDQGAYFSNYPDLFNSLSKIQIQRGVGTSKNGVSSYGGSIQLFSQNLSDSAKTSFGFGYGSFGSLRAFGEYASGIKNRKALYVRASKIYSDGYKINSSNNSQSVFLSSGFFLEKSTWKLNFLAGHQQNQLAWLGVTEEMIKSNRRANANRNEKDEFTQCLFQLQNSWKPSAHSSFQSSVYYSYLNGNYDFDWNAFLGFPGTNQVYNYAFKSNLIGFFSNYTFSKKHFNLTSGIHGNVYQRQHIDSEKSLGHLYTNTGFKNEASMFTKADYTLNRLTLFADVQYRYASFDYVSTVPFDKMYWTFLNPKAGLSFSVNSNTLLYYSIGRTGREPTRNDMFRGNDEIYLDSLGNSILSIQTPESVVDNELGIRYQTNRLTISFNAYFMDFKNEIVLDGKYGPNGLPLTNKVDRSYRAGLEFNLTYKVNSKVSLINNSSFNQSRIKELSTSFTPILTPKVIFNQEAVYVYKGLTLGLSARYQGESFIDFANNASIYGYLLLNSRITYDIKGIQLSFFVNNITNTNYYTNAYVELDGTKKYFVQAPINVFGSIKYSF
ncbi:MAG: TonB-dependent receptor [Bacteroidetes bacterium B1(2017)]|nr:MAG: TonB-dependent receptor [Bacteroidetes bacterium B1(2017)]